MFCDEMKFTFPIVVATALTGCMGLRATKHTYQSSGQSIKVGGAKVSMDFRPEGSRPGSMVFSAMVVGAALATFDGPFRWRVEAIGEQGVHESLVVHRIRTKTAKTRRDGWFPAEQLGRKASFRSFKGEPGRVRARYPIPGLLEVMPETDGRLDVWMDLSVSGKTGSERKMVHFVLDPSLKDQNEMIFIPVEIVEGFGKPLSEQDDPMWG